MDLRLPHVWWFVRFIIEALVEFVIIEAWELSTRRSWAGWIPALVVALLGVFLAWLALSNSLRDLAAVCLAVGAVPAGVRAVYVALVPTAARRG